MNDFVRTLALATNLRARVIGFGYSCGADHRDTGDCADQPFGDGFRARSAPLLDNFDGPSGKGGNTNDLGRSALQQRRVADPRGSAGIAGRHPAAQPLGDCRRHRIVVSGHGDAANLKSARWLFAMAAGIAAGLPIPAAAQSQYSPVCGVTGYATAPASITYDPFSPGGLSQAIIPLILQRNRGILTGRTDEISLVLVAPAGAPPVQVTYQGQNVLYQEGATAGRPRSLDSRDNGAGAGGEIRYKFGGLFASDLSAPLNLRVSVPPGTDLSAGETIHFDILYICSGDGGMRDVPSPVRESRVIRLDVNTVSALQAYYAGSVLDFGEIGDVSTQQVLASPDRYTTAATNSLRVRSSGPFEVRVRSQNDFRLTFPGGQTANAAESIRYSVRFLGQDIASNATFGTRTCARAGVAGATGHLPIRAKLTEGGAGKAPSSSYGDTVTVTFTPIVSASAAQQCAGL